MKRLLRKDPAVEGLVTEYRSGAITRREFLRRAGILAVAGKPLALLLGSSFAPVASAQTDRRGGLSVWSLDADPVAINPIESPGGTTREAIYDTVYESLTMFDENMQVVPALAESWENPDPLTWIFNLRRGVKFHHGRELDAEDIAWWLQNLNDPNVAAVHRSSFAMVQSVTKIDDHTVELLLKEPFGPLLRTFAQLFGSSIIARDWRDAVPNLNFHAVGTGPFKVTTFEPASHLILEKHLEYWDDPRPYLDVVTIRILTDEDTRIGALRSGSIHQAVLSPDGARRLANDPQVRVLRTPSSLVYTHMFNTRVAPFDDVRVRKAVDLAIDRNEVIEKVAAGEGVLTGPVPTGMGNYFIPIPELPYRRDLEEARRLLTEAGYPNGFEATLITRATIPQNINSSVILAEQLRPLGINVRIEQLEPGIFTTRGVAHEFNIMANLWSPRIDPDAYFGRSFVSTSDQNWMGWGTPELDRLIAEARGLPTDTEREPLYRQIQSVVLDEVPVIWWYATNVIEGVSNRIDGYWQSPLVRRPGMKDAYLT